MKIVYQGGEGEITEKKSRFIATVRPVESEEEAAAFIAERAVQHQYIPAFFTFHFLYTVFVYRPSGGSLPFQGSLLPFSGAYPSIAAETMIAHKQQDGNDDQAGQPVMGNQHDKHPYCNQKGS